jgi:hypothetical protein
MIAAVTPGQANVHAAATAPCVTLWRAAIGFRASASAMFRASASPVKSGDCERQSFAAARRKASASAPSLLGSGCQFRRRPNCWMNSSFPHDIGFKRAGSASTAGETLDCRANPTAGFVEQKDRGGVGDRADYGGSAGDRRRARRAVSHPDRQNASPALRRSACTRPRCFRTSRRTLQNARSLSIRRRTKPCGDRRTAPR